MSAPIPFNKPALTGKELIYIADAIHRSHASGDGYYSKLCHRYLEEKLRVQKALLTTSCTHALEMAAILCNIQPGDEVIVPSFTFTSTINAFVLRGAKPVFCDVRSDTLNLDENLIEGLITKKTKAIIPVHYAGVACEMNQILEVAKQNQLYVIEDNAQGIFGSYNGKPLGSFGELSTLSFHETKNINCGEGGALLINEPSLVERAEVIREKGTNRSQFFRGEVDKYGWVDIGSSFLPSDILAAYLWAQLENSQSIIQKRKTVWNNYFEGLKDWAVSEGVQMPAVPVGVEPSYHLFYLVFPNLEMRSEYIKHLKEKGISAVFHYQALNASLMGTQLGGTLGQCPIAERMSDCLVRLPLFNTISEEETWRVIEASNDFKLDPQKVVFSDLAA